jgi:uncharacterized glyoxalase superfamily protein PhnB
MARESDPLDPEDAAHHAPGVQPILCVEDLDAAVAFYKTIGFDAMLEVPLPDGTGLAYAILRFGNSFVHISPLSVDDPVHPEWMRATNQGPRGLGVQLYVIVRDVAAHFQKVSRAKMQILSEPKDEFWGDRVFIAQDPFGYIWNFAEHMTDVPPDEMETAAQRS